MISATIAALPLPADCRHRYPTPPVNESHSGFRSPQHQIGAMPRAQQSQISQRFFRDSKRMSCESCEKLCVITTAPPKIAKSPARWLHFVHPATNHRIGFPNPIRIHRRRSHIHHRHPPPQRFARSPPAAPKRRCRAPKINNSSGGSINSKKFRRLRTKWNSSNTDDRPATSALHAIFYNRLWKMHRYRSGLRWTDSPIIIRWPSERWMPFGNNRGDHHRVSLG